MPTKVGTREEWLAARNELLAREVYKRRMEWQFPWVSTYGSEFAFAHEDGVVYHTYTWLAPDRDFVVPYYHQLLDRTPRGRVDEFRATRRDEYEDAQAV